LGGLRLGLGLPIAAHAFGVPTTGVRWAAPCGRRTVHAVYCAVHHATFDAQPKKEYRLDGTLVGGIGVSGGLVEQSCDISEAGTTVF
jgi:hypothetical protein